MLAAKGLWENTTTVCGLHGCCLLAKVSNIGVAMTALTEIKLLPRLGVSRTRPCQTKSRPRPKNGKKWLGWSKRRLYHGGLMGNVADLNLSETTTGNFLKNSKKGKKKKPFMNSCHHPPMYPVPMWNLNLLWRYWFFMLHQEVVLQPHTAGCFGTALQFRAGQQGVLSFSSDRCLSLVVRRLIISLMILLSIMHWWWCW